MFWQIIVIKHNTPPPLLDDVLFFFIFVLFLCKRSRGVAASATKAINNNRGAIEVNGSNPPQPIFGPTNSYQHQ